MVNRLYVGSSSLRLESPHPGPWMICDAGRKVTWVVLPARKEYREVKGVNPAIADLLPKPGGDPCKAELVPPGARCRRLGGETVNGRATERWEIAWGVSGSRLISRQWIDRRIGAQPAHLFQVPKGYTRAQ